MFPASVEVTLANVAFTLSFFLDPNPLMVAENQEFIAEKMQWNMILRNKNQVNISAEEIRSGDYLGIMRRMVYILNHVGNWRTHWSYCDSLWFEDGLYICESTGTEGFNFLVYWPPPYGIIRTPYEQAARSWFNTVQGMPYGWHNFMFTFLDTEWNNLPRPATPDLFEYLIGVLERLIPVDMNSSVFHVNYGIESSIKFKLY